MRYILLATLVLLVAQPLSAQSGRTDFLRRMDDNRNGRLEPSEISDRARRYLERFAREAGVRLSGSVSIRQLEEGARRYYERRARESDRRGSSSSSSDSDSGTGVPGFGPDEDTLIVPGFGPDVKIRYPYTRADEERADERIRQYDRNRDGKIDRAEAERARWSGSPFFYDFNRDGMLSRIELAQRYARRRTGSSDSERDERRRDSDDERDESDRRRAYRRSGDARGAGRPDRRTYELAYSIVARHDRNGNRVLDRREWAAAGDNMDEADEDRDGSITRGELAVWLARDIESQYDDTTAELPDWFFELDANRDNQISMSEFAEQWSAEKLEEFARFDRNGDGFVTEKELLSFSSVVGGTYKNEKAKVILPKGLLVSDIFIDDDYLIGDLDVQLSITHTNTQQLNAYLVGPDETRVELFSGVGRSDDHFDGTIFDDEASQRITRARPPFRGKFQPESVERDGPSLRHFYGQRVEGLWQLEIRTSRGDRPGMLHGWSLIIQPAEERQED